MTLPTKGTLRATLTEVEPGLFSARYPGEMNADGLSAEAFPDSHLGTDPAGVKTWVEQMAVQLGYDRVEWIPPDKP